MQLIENWIELKWWSIGLKTLISEMDVYGDQLTSRHSRLETKTWNKRETQTQKQKKKKMLTRQDDLKRFKT